MKKIEVRIREKDKHGKILSLLNLREEVVNVLYKDTVAHSTKADMQFFVLLFFISIKFENKTLLEYVLDSALPKFSNLNKAFSQKKRRLRAKEYQKMVAEHGLESIFKFDVFFILVEAILNIDEIKQRYVDFFSKSPKAIDLIEKIKDEYAKELEAGLNDFKSSHIEDDRYDDEGNYHDLSKSVYRTVRMRNARNLDLNLQKYTSVQEISSQSPVILDFIQYVDPQLIFELWEKYNLAEYTKLVAGATFDAIKSHVDFNINIGNIAEAWLIWRLTNRLDRAEKERKKSELQLEKNKPANQEVLDTLTERLVDSVLKANERLQQEVDETRKKLDLLQGDPVATQNKEEIKKVRLRLEELENLEITAKVKVDKK